MKLRLFTAAALLLVVSVAVAAEPESKDGWKSMFDGKTLSRWKVNENAESFKVVDGAIVAHGKRAHLFYIGDETHDHKPYKNFEFEADVMTKPKANAGVYFHTKFQPEGWPKFGYEVQVNNTHRDPIKTGSLYQVKNVTEAPAEDGKWFKLSFKVDGKHITTSVDGKLLVDYTEPADKEAGKDFTRVLDSGTFALQAHDPESVVMFKDLRVRRLP